MVGRRTRRGTGRGAADPGDASLRAVRAQCGALLAFEVSHALVRRGRRPDHLFVSGLDAPHRRVPSPVVVHTLPDEALRDALSVLRGTPPEVLDSPSCCGCCFRCCARTRR
ncbi:thioesterase domain-containing protein [Streptomyces sp. M19]